MAIDRKDKKDERGSVGGVRKGGIEKKKVWKKELIDL